MIALRQRDFFNLEAEQGKLGSPSLRELEPDCYVATTGYRPSAIA
jgi:hypothetical protein